MGNRDQEKASVFLGLFMVTSLFFGFFQPTAAWSEGYSPHLFEVWEEALEESKYIDINSAGPEEWERLPGIGPSKAKKIIEWRERFGPWTEIDQLREVPGIGRMTFMRIRPYLKIEQPQELLDG